MQREKALKLIEAVKNMSDWEADILEVFLAGFRAGKQSAGKDSEKTPPVSPADRVGQM